MYEVRNEVIVYEKDLWKGIVKVYGTLDDYIDGVAYSLWNCRDLSGESIYRRTSFEYAFKYFIKVDIDLNYNGTDCYTMAANPFYYEGYVDTKKYTRRYVYYTSDNRIINPFMFKEEIKKVFYAYCSGAINRTYTYRYRRRYSRGHKSHSVWGRVKWHRFYNADKTACFTDEVAHRKKSSGWKENTKSLKSWGLHKHRADNKTIRKVDYAEGYNVDELLYLDFLEGLEEDGSK